MSFGQRLKQLRLERRLNQRELAARVGIDFTYLSKLENGRMEPPAEETICRLAASLEVEPTELLLLAQKDSQTEEPGEKDLYPIGTVGVIMRMLKLPDSRIRVLVQGVCRARVEGFLKGGACLEARIQRIVEPRLEPSLELEALVRTTKKSLERSVSLGWTQNRLAPSPRPAPPLALESSVPVHLPFHDARKAWNEQFEQLYVTALLRQTAGNITRAAEIAGLNRRSLQRMMTRMGIRE